MNRFRIFYCATFSFFIFSCKSNEDIAVHSLKGCINDNLAQIRSTYSPDISEYMSMEITLRKFETFLLSENYLDSIDKESYSSLINKIVGNPANYSEVYDHIINRDVYLDDIVLLNAPLMLNQCVEQVLLNERNTVQSTLSQQRSIMLGIIDSHYTDLDLIQSLFDSTPDDYFKKVIYRIPFIYIITMNAEKNNYSGKELE